MKIILVFILFIVLFVLYVRYLENKTLFYPAKLLSSTPNDIGVSYEDVFITTEDGCKLHGWFVPAEDSRSTLLFFHGNAGNISDRLGKIQLFHRMRLNVLIIDYRGFGQSNGKPTESGMYLDAKAAFDYLKNSKKDMLDSLIVYGASLGGVAAINLASREEITALIVDSSFSNAVDMAKRIYPFIPSFLVTIKLDNISKIKKISIPKLFIHSVDDMTIPYSLGQKLFEAAKDPKEMLTISGGHNDGHIHDEEKYNSAIEIFLDQHQLR